MKKSKPKNLSAGILSQRWLIINSFFVLVCAVSAYALVSSLQKASYFTVNKVIIREKGEINSGKGAFEYFKGRNIFDVDLTREAARLQFLYPGYRMIRLARFLPDCIFVDFLRRIPVASVKGSRLFFVDAGSVLFEQPGEDGTDLPLITGLERDLSQPRVGRRFEQKELLLSLEVLRAMREDTALVDYRVSRIDAAAPANLVFFLYPSSASPAVAVKDGQGGDGPESAQGVEVRVGSEAIPAKMQILATVLIQMRSNFDNIKYIDLRFKEPVIKFKNMDNFSRNS